MEGRKSQHGSGAAKPAAKRSPKPGQRKIQKSVFPTPAEGVRVVLLLGAFQTY